MKKNEKKKVEMKAEELKTVAGGAPLTFDPGYTLPPIVTPVFPGDWRHW